MQLSNRTRTSQPTSSNRSPWSAHLVIASSKEPLVGQASNEMKKLIRDEGFIINP